MQTAFPLPPDTVWREMVQDFISKQQVNVGVHAGNGVRSKMEFVMGYEIQTTSVYDPLPMGYRTSPPEMSVVNRITKPNDKL